MTSFMWVLMPSAVFIVTLVGFNGPVNSLSMVLVIGVAELSMINNMPSVFHENGSLGGSLFLVCTLMYICGNGLSRLLRRRPCLTNTFFSHDRIT